MEVEALDFNARLSQFENALLLDVPVWISHASDYPTNTATDDPLRAGDIPGAPFGTRLKSRVEDSIAQIGVTEFPFHQRILCMVSFRELTMMRSGKNPSIFDHHGPNMWHLT